ncbi:hypothetical protein FB45DRAFT_1105948 [Roridomyces roridus]|uniref:Uncharacterized protein n=1 Tax=Roridomyces roridus TaxID=1738132 RepID=A0AAD7FD04_9AGAR|nr:hypothetical protein FB45DRAFT_1105948 [Roridomyces roridus]
MSFILATGLAEGLLELGLFGVFTSLFSAVIYLFAARGLIWKRPVVFIVPALVGLFLAVTAHCINTILSLYFVFVHLGGGVPGELFYLTLNSPLSLAHISLVEVATFIVDSLVIHRVYIVWSSNKKVIIFPLFFIVSQLVSGTHIIVDFSRETLHNFYSLSNPWVVASLVSSLIINVYSTGMIINKMWPMSRSLERITGSRSSGKRLKRVLAVMVESAVLQTTWTICILVSFQIGLLIQDVFTALQPVVFGISLLLIHARVGLGWAKESLSSEATGLTVNLNTTTMRTQRPEELEDDVFERRKQWARESAV